MNYNISAPLRVKKIVNGAYGLSDLPNGKTVFIRRSLPGELVRVRITEDQEKLCYADVIDVIEPHPDRIIPPCGCYAECGGCDLQHAHYRLQCSLKQEILTELLQRNPTTSAHELDRLVQHVLGSDTHFGYRQRIRLQAKPPLVVGFNRFRSHEVIPVRTCLLAPPALNRCLAKLCVSAALANISGHLKEIEILEDPGSAAPASYCASAASHEPQTALPQGNWPKSSAKKLASFSQAATLQWKGRSAPTPKPTTS